MASVIANSPLGWWFTYDDKHWCGPYETDEKALEEAQYLVPLKFSTFTLLKAAPWETKTVNTKTMTVKEEREPCPSCEGTGFVAGSCCRKCEGSMSIKKEKP